MDVMRDQILNQTVDVLHDNKKNFTVGTNLVTSAAFDMSEVVDLNDEENLNFMEEMKDGIHDLVIDVGGKDDDKEQEDGEGKKHTSLKEKTRQQTEAEEAQFMKDYMKTGGIQHIVCSATMTIDNKGRVTPRQ